MFAVGRGVAERSGNEKKTLGGTPPGPVFRSSRGSFFASEIDMLEQFWRDANDGTLLL